MKKSILLIALLVLVFAGRAHAGLLDVDVTSAVKTVSGLPQATGLFHDTDDRIGLAIYVDLTNNSSHDSVEYRMQISWHRPGGAQIAHWLDFGRPNREGLHDFRFVVR